MIITRKAVARRTFLRGAGAAVALPFLDSMVPALAKAATTPKPPVRMAFVYVPNGVDQRSWTLGYEGKLDNLSRILKPLDPYKQDINVLGNLTHNAGRALLDGPGDHGRCSASYLTGIQPRKTMSDIKVGVSFDQIVGNHVGAGTSFNTLELGLEDARQAGDCDSGYSCAYTNNLAWRAESQPLPPTLNPRALFERLFGDDAALSPEARRRRNLYRGSVLDIVSADAKRLAKDLGPTDQRKLDEYLSSVREIELQLARADSGSIKIDPGFDKPYGIPADFAEHFSLMTNMLTVAFQSNLTRVATFLVTREGTSRAYREIGIPDGHHPLTHHRGQPDLVEKVAQINTYHVEQFAKWVGKLKSIKEGDATLLDNSMIVYGAGLADGNKHSHEDLPVVMAGRGGSSFVTGRSIVYRKETPMCNMFLTMMDRMGVPTEHFGDSSGRLEGLDLA
jgi:hypothetical protein